jgi:hypothetical protein
LMGLIPIQAFRLRYFSDRSRRMHDTRPENSFLERRQLLGVKSITKHLNAADTRTRGGGRWVSAQCTRCSHGRSTSAATLPASLWADGALDRLGRLSRRRPSKLARAGLVSGDLQIRNAVGVGEIGNAALDWP